MTLLETALKLIESINYDMAHGDIVSRKTLDLSGRLHEKVRECQDRLTGCVEIAVVKKGELAGV